MARAELITRRVAGIDNVPVLKINLKDGHWLELSCRNSNYKHGDLAVIRAALGHAALAIETYKQPRKRKTAAKAKAE